MGVGIALGVGAAAAAGGSIFSGIMGKQAAKKQAEALKRSTEEAKQYSREYRDLSQGWLKPFQATGAKANQSLSDILAGKINLDDMVQSSSLFKFQQQEGERAINRQLRARGLYGSGAGLETLARFENQLVGEEGERYMSRLFGLSNAGQQAAGALATIDQNVGRSLADLTMGGGASAANALYQGDMAIAGLPREIGGIIQSAAGSYGQLSMMQPFLQRMAGGAGKSGLAGLTEDQLAGQLEEAKGRGIIDGTNMMPVSAYRPTVLAPPVNDYTMGALAPENWASTF